jgi:hypothetical protein
MNAADGNNNNNVLAIFVAPSDAVLRELTDQAIARYPVIAGLDAATLQQLMEALVRPNVYAGMEAAAVMATVGRGQQYAVRNALPWLRDGIRGVFEQMVTLQKEASMQGMRSAAAISMGLVLLSDASVKPKQLKRFGKAVLAKFHDGVRAEVVDGLRKALVASACRRWEPPRTSASWRRRCLSRPRPPPRWTR